MIVWDILGWMLVIILGVFCLPIFIGLLYVLGYILFWTVLIINITVITVIEFIKSIFTKMKKYNKIIWITKKQRQCSLGNTQKTKLIYGKNTQQKNVDYKI